MTNKLFFTVISCFFLFTSSKAQLPFTYTVDSTSFSMVSIEGGMTQVRFADVNHDGNLDIVTIGDHGNPNVNASEHGIMVFFGNGTGTGWNLVQNGAFGYGGCAVGDINNDGKEDIAYSLHHNYGGAGGTQLIEAQTGDGTGMAWTPYDGGLAANGETWGMFGTDLGDINNDGWLDIGSNAFGYQSGVHLYKNNQNGTWTQSFQTSTGNTGHYIQFGDIDGDGNLDFVASHYYGCAFFGNGTGSFTMKTAGLPAITNFPYLDVSLTDIDNDGDDDFIFTNKNYSTNISGVYAYTWNRSTQQWEDHSTGLPTGVADKFVSARAADIDMDGFADIVLTSDSLNDVEVWKGNGGMAWTKAYSFAMSQFTGAEEITIGDIDHSGYPDVLIWGSYLGGGPFNPTTQNKIRMFRDKVIPIDLNVKVLYPKGAECWRNNSVKFIKWISAVPGNHASTVKIEYSTIGSGGPWIQIAAAAPNNGTYQWTVPTVANSPMCFIRVMATDNVTSATATAINAIPFNMGCISSTTDVNEAAETNLISVYPNPASESLNFEYQLQNAGQIDVKLMNCIGQIVAESDLGLQAAGIHNSKINLSAYPAGIYNLLIASGNNNLLTQKIVISR